MRRTRWGGVGERASDWAGVSFNAVVQSVTIDVVHIVSTRVLFSGCFVSSKMRVEIFVWPKFRARICDRRFGDFCDEHGREEDGCVRG